MNAKDAEVEQFYEDLQDSPVQFCSVSQSSPTLCEPMDYSTQSFPVHHQLLEFTQTHVHLTWWCHPTISFSVVLFSYCLQSFPESGSFQMNHFLTSVGQSSRVSASAYVCPMNSQDWFPSGWTGFILLSKGVSRVFSNTTVQKHQFFSAQLSLMPNSHIHTWLDSHSFEDTDICYQSNVSAF